MQLHLVVKARLDSGALASYSCECDTASLLQLHPRTITGHNQRTEANWSKQQQETVRNVKSST